MDKCIKAFNTLYEYHGIQLPDDAPSAGEIIHNGWTIRYHFIEIDGQRFLEFFSSHRFTNDRLCRIDAEGNHKIVDCCQEYYLADHPGAKEAYYEHNRVFYERLKSLGFWP